MIEKSPKILSKNKKIFVLSFMKRCTTSQPLKYEELPKRNIGFKLCSKLQFPTIILKCTFSFILDNPSISESAEKYFIILCSFDREIGEEIIWINSVWFGNYKDFGKFQNFAAFCFEFCSPRKLCLQKCSQPLSL